MYISENSRIADPNACQRTSFACREIITKLLRYIRKNSAIQHRSSLMLRAIRTQFSLLSSIDLSLHSNANLESSFEASRSIQVLCIYRGKKKSDREASDRSKKNEEKKKIKN